MSDIAAAIPDAAPAVTVAEQRVLARIFQHPLSHNLSWRETLALIHAIGSVEHAHNGDVVLKLGGRQQTFKPTHDKDLAAEDVMTLRRFLTSAGWAPGGASMPAAASATSDLAIVIADAGARIYELAPDAGHSSSQETHHLLHDIERGQHDADREETWPADRHFFDAIASAVTGSGRIVVVGHGKGQSREADHLMADLKAHHGAVHARIASEIVAYLPHTTVPQLVQLARNALQPEPNSAVAGTD